MTESNIEANSSNRPLMPTITRGKFMKFLAAGVATLVAAPLTACLPKAEAKPVQKQDVVPFVPNYIVSPEVYQQATEEEKRMLDEHEALSGKLKKELLNQNILNQYGSIPSMIYAEDLREAQERQRNGLFQLYHTINTGNSRGFSIMFITHFNQGEVTSEEIRFSFNSGRKQFPHFGSLDKILTKYYDEYKGDRTKPYTADEIKEVISTIFELEKLSPKKPLNWQGVVEKGSREPSFLVEGITPEGKKYQLKVASTQVPLSNDRSVSLKIS